MTTDMVDRYKYISGITLDFFFRKLNTRVPIRFFKVLNNKTGTLTL